jgi:RimJ/RimL family protein N-acetyltransferase
MLFTFNGVRTEGEAALAMVQAGLVRLELKRIVSTGDVANAASARVLEKLRPKRRA